MPLPFVVLGAFFAFFFRDPERVSPDEAHVVLSPADGRVLVAGAAEPGVAPPGEWQQISIFLSPMDVHVNRMPASGRSRGQLHARQVPARVPTTKRRRSTSAARSGSITAGQTVVARQIVGILARRVVCRARVGEQVRAGERFGIMKFGSRMDVFLPPSATIRGHGRRDGPRRRNRHRGATLTAESRRPSA